MGIERGHLVGIQLREDLVDEGTTAGHPLVIVPAGVVVGPVEPGCREARLEPAKDPFVPNMHPQHDLGLATIAAERALADEQPGENAAIELGERIHDAGSNRDAVSPGRKT
jgi:hypothetical protein